NRSQRSDIPFDRHRTTAPTTLWARIRVCLFWVRYRSSRHEPLSNLDMINPNEMTRPTYARLSRWTRISRDRSRTRSSSSNSRGDAARPARDGADEATGGTKSTVWSGCGTGIGENTSDASSDWYQDVTRRKLHSVQEYARAER